MNRNPPGMKKAKPQLELLKPEVTAGLLARFRLTHLLKKFPERPMWALFMFINGFIAIAIMSGIAMLSHTPFIFPSLGPTAYLLFFSPRSETSTPRNSLIGHAIGLLCGYAAYRLMGMPAAITAPHSAFNWDRIIAAALSLAATGALMILFNASHPPAGATTLIVSLGIITKPMDLVIIEAAVVLLILQAFYLNRLAGVPYPRWRYASQ